MKLFIPSEVESSLLSTAMYYEDCRSGLGSDFFKRVSEIFQSIEDHPLSFPFYEGNQPTQSFRRARMKQFPYIVLFSIEDNTILIVEVAHTSREPGYWSSDESSE